MYQPDHQQQPHREPRVIAIVATRNRDLAWKTMAIWMGLLYVTGLLLVHLQ